MPITCSFSALYHDKYRRHRPLLFIFNTLITLKYAMLHIGIILYCIIAYNQKCWKPLSLYMEYQSPNQEVNEREDVACRGRKDWLIDYMVFYAVSAIFRPYNGGGRIEIKWLLQNYESDLLGVGMLFEIQKSQLTPHHFYFKKDLSTSEVTLQQTRKSF